MAELASRERRGRGWGQGGIAEAPLAIEVPAADAEQGILRAPSAAQDPEVSNLLPDLLSRSVLIGPRLESRELSALTDVSGMTESCVQCRAKMLSRPAGHACHSSLHRALSLGP